MEPREMPSLQAPGWAFGHGCSSQQQDSAERMWSEMPRMFHHSNAGGGIGILFSQIEEQMDAMLRGLGGFGSGMDESRPQIPSCRQPTTKEEEGFRVHEV